jgi:4-amino-4-deoxy-L-arabinose transferase-like glycosyltransferase
MAVLLGLFIVGGSVYNFSVPVFEKPDESYHFFFALHLARGLGLPVQSEASQDSPWSYEASQPPLYYWLVSRLIQWLPLQNAEDVLVRNPHAAVGFAYTEGNKNVYIHPVQEPLGAPVVLAVRLARWVSLLMGVVTVWATVRLGREVLPRSQDLVWAVTALVAFTPQFLFISTSVSNDTTVTAAVTVGLWLLIRAVRHGLTRLESLLLAVVCGLAALAKLGGLLFLPLEVGILVIVAWLDRKDRHPRTTVHPLILIAGSLLAVILIAGWWYWRNWSLYGDWTGLRPMFDIIGRESPPSISHLRWELQGLRISYWALFGWFSILVDRWAYYLLDVVLVMALAGLIFRSALVILRSWRGRSKPELRPENVASSRGWVAWFLIITWPVLVFAGVLRTTVQMNVSQGRLLFPAVAPIAVLIVMGVLTWVPRRFWRGFLILAGVMWLGWTFSLPPRFIQPAYALPPHGPDINVPAHATRLDLNYGPVRLLAYDVTPERVDRGEPLHITLYWRTTSPLEEAYSVAVKLLGRSGQLLAGVDSYPGRGMYPTNLWQTEETVVDRYTLTVSSEADLPVLAELWVDMYRHQDLKPLPVTTQDGTRLAKPQIASVRVAPRSSASLEPPLARFDDGIALEEAAIDPLNAESSQSITVQLAWRCYATPSADYTVFLHLVSPAHDPVPLAQIDAQPRGGSYPTGVWTVGDKIPDMYQLKLPSTVPSGDYDLLLGLYHLETRTRVPLADGTGDHIQLAKLRFDDHGWEAKLLDK